MQERQSVAICHVERDFQACFLAIMDPFRRCVQDLEAITRLLELPHGRDIALLMFRELSPYLIQLASLLERDPTGAVRCLFDYAETVQGHLGVKLETLAPPASCATGARRLNVS